MGEPQRRWSPRLNAAERRQNEKMIGSYKKCLKTVLSGVQENIKLQLNNGHTVLDTVDTLRQKW